jgi:hypothetical protein
MCKGDVNARSDPVHETTKKELDVMVKVFISYKRNVEPDEPLALRLYEASREHCDVFIDQQMPVGTDWAERIQAELEACDYLIPLLSKHSVHSEMVEAEIRTAHHLRFGHRLAGLADFGARPGMESSLLVDVGDFPVRV